MTDSYLEELESWFKQRPVWLQDAARRIIAQGNLDDSDYNYLKKACLVEAGFKFKKEVAEPLAIPNGALSPKEQQHKVEICSISNPIGINFLNPKKALGVLDGLSVIYGTSGGI